MVGKLRSAAGYTMAAAAFVIVLITFVGNDYLGRAFARVTGITVSARYTGGEVVREIDHGNYRALIHRPVFDGLFGERSDGFIQIKWYGTPPWPRTLEEAIDYDGDNLVDFAVTLDTGTLKAELSRQNSGVVGIEKTYKLNKGFAVRILLQKKPSGGL